ncbi:MAG: histidine kinase dimerization/phospho-acceptor domain-containing protein [Pirellulaceae bacterium]
MPTATGSSHSHPMPIRPIANASRAEVAVAAETAVAAPNVESLQHEIEMLRTQLDQARRMSTIGELTSTTTHEFNNLLTTILNYAKLGQRHKDEPSRDKAFTRIYDAANRATKITGSILSMARSRSGQMEPTDLKSIVEDTLLLLEREFRKYRIALEVVLEDNLPQIQATGSDLQRVLINLLVNARQATPEGGGASCPAARTQESGLDPVDSR